MRADLRRRSMVTAMTAGLALAVMSLGQAMGATVINSSTPLPYTISAAGVYELGSNLNNVAGTAIIIDADNVRLDLKGYTIDGTGMGDGVRVTGTSENVAIVNGKIQQFCNGVKILAGARTVDIRDMKIGYNKVGVKACGADVVSVVYCLVVNNDDCGIDLRDGDDHCLANNRIARNGTDTSSTACESGVLVQGGSYHRITCNTVTDNADGGLELRGITDSDVYSNKATGNTNSGIFLGPHLGTGAGSARNRVTQNRSSENGYGILVSYGSTNNRVEWNVALFNDYYDLFDGNADCDDNIWRNNTFVSDNEAGADYGPGVGCIR